MPRRYCPPAWWPVLLLPWYCLAGAGQPEEASRLETIDVKAVRAQQLPGSAAVINGKTLEAVAATHPAELAARQPGFWVSRGGGQEHLTALRSPVWTGPGACGEILFAEDGVPVRPAGFCNINQFVELDTEQAAGIEVLRGTQGGALYGSNALHGVINVLTPVFADRRALRLEAGPRDYTRLGWQYSDADTVLALNLAHDGGYQDSSGYDQQKLLWKQRQSFGDVSLVHSLAAIHMDQQSIGYLVGDEAYRDDARQRDNPDPDAWRDVDAWRYVQHWDWQAGAWQHSVRPYLRYTAMDFTQHFNPGDPLEENGHRSLGLQWLVAHDDFGWGSWQGGAEADLAHTWTHEWQEKPSMGTSPQGEHYDYQVDTAQVAAWQELAWHWTERLDARFGLRVDRLAYDYDSRLPAGRSGRFTRPADRSDGFTLVSPRIGLVYTAAPGSEWFANASTGRRAPQTAELYRLQGPQQVADIDSVAADSGELGWRGWRDGAGWAVVLYDMHKDNVIIRNSARVLSDDARTRHRGIEFSLQQQWRNGLFAGVAATYAEHRYDSDLFDSSTGVDSRLMDSAPRTLGSVQAGWESVSTRVELEWQHVGDYALNPENTFVYDGHDLLHLRAQHRLDAQWLVFARLMNLTGRDYAERADVTAFPVVEPRYFVGLPRSLFVGVEWNY